MPTDLTLAELSALADVPTRTIRFYLAQGLLPAPGREGPGTRYPVSVLHRLRLIRQLQREHLPLAEIRKRLAGLSDAEVEALAGEPDEPPPDSALEYVRGVLARPTVPLARAVPSAGPGTGAVPGPAVPSPAPAPSPSSPPPMPSAPPAVPAVSGERSQWERIVLEPDVELHVRRPLSRLANKRVDRLIAFARELLEEDRS